MKLLNEILGTRYPIIQGGMANIATGEFAAACSNGGALGVIACGGLQSGEALRKALDDSRLADARLADEGGVVLIFPAQNLQQLPKLAFAPDDRLHCRRLFDHVLTI